MIICIVGPTGVGKTSLSLKLAKHYGLDILSADATQIYKELNIGSAKVEDKQNINHYLLDIKNPDEDYSVSDYQKDSRKILDEKKDIIVVGGTGLYIKAMLYNYEFFDIKKNDVYDNLSNEELYSLALKKDPLMNIHKNNRVRLINFLNKDKMSSSKDEKKYDFICIGLTANREEVYKNADKRVDYMFENGLVEEVKSLYEKYPNALILKRAIGYKEVIEYLCGNISLDDAKELIKKNTRHYIKRQYTWFNNQMDVKWFNTNFSDFDKTVDEVIKYIDSQN